MTFIWITTSISLKYFAWCRWSPRQALRRFYGVSGFTFIIVYMPTIMLILLCISNRIKCSIMFSSVSECYTLIISCWDYKRLANIESYNTCYRWFVIVSRALVPFVRRYTCKRMIALYMLSIIVSVSCGFRQSGFAESRHFRNHDKTFAASVIRGIIQLIELHALVNHPT